MLRLAKGRLPPTNGVDRFHFPVTPTLTINANDKDKLIGLVFEYRLRNGIEVGDVEADIDSYYCRTWPSFCTNVNGTAGAQPKSGEPMLNRVTRWAASAIHQNHMPKGGYPLSTVAEADRRAEICVNCPKNVAWRGGCGSCSSSTLAVLQQLKQLKKTRFDGSLRACQVAGFELTTAVWLPYSATPITTDQRAAMPEACWRKPLP